MKLDAYLQQRGHLLDNGQTHTSDGLPLTGIQLIILGEYGVVLRFRNPGAGVADINDQLSELFRQLTDTDPWFVCVIAFCNRFLRTLPNNTGSVRTIASVISAAIKLAEKVPWNTSRDITKNRRLFRDLTRDVECRTVRADSSI